MDDTTRQALVKLVEEMRLTAVSLEQATQTDRMSERDSWKALGEARGYEFAADMVEDLLLEDQDD